MEFMVTLLVIAIGWTYMRKLENKVDTQADRIYILEQLLEMNLIKDGKEKTETSESKEAKAT
jgi:hypothetical protein